MCHSPHFLGANRGANLCVDCVELDVPDVVFGTQEEIDLRREMQQAFRL